MPRLGFSEAFWAFVFSVVSGEVFLEEGDCWAVRLVWLRVAVTGYMRCLISQERLVQELSAMRKAVGAAGGASDK